MTASTVIQKRDRVIARSWHFFLHQYFLFSGTIFIAALSG
jgi:hypothetical protein